MNYQQHYQYQMPVSAGVQGIAGHAPSPYLANPGLTGGMHVAMPPPPPPGAFTIGPSPKLALTTPQPVCVEPSANNENPVPVEQSDSSNNSSKSSADTATGVADNEPSELKSIPANMAGATTTTTAVGGSAVPTPVALPSNTQAPSWVGGVYAAAYIQQAVPQQPASIAAAQPQYMVTPAGLPPSFQNAPGSKLMYLPSSYAQGIGGNPYMQAGAPTIVTDHTGKAYIVNNSYQPQLQYQVQPPGMLKPAAAAAQQYVIASPHCYSGVQAPAAMQPMYGRVPTPVTQPVAALGAVPGIPHNAAGVPTSQVYYYY